MNANNEFRRPCVLEGRHTLSHVGICLERLRKPATYLREDSQWPVRYSDRLPPLYKHKRYYWNNFAWYESVADI